MGALKRLPVALLIVALAACVSSPYAVASTWTVLANGGRAVAIADGVVIVQFRRMVDSQETFSVAAYDVASGRELWHRDGPQAVAGTPLFLGDGARLERVDPRSGRVLWRSRALCSQAPPEPAYIKVVGASVYAGCVNAGVFRLRLADGRVVASQGGVSIAVYHTIEPLPHGTLGVAGYQQSIYLTTQTYILNARTLEPVEPLPMFRPGRLVLGVHNGEAIEADVCCGDKPDTNSPGAIAGVSLTTGDARWSVAIHPYHPPMPLSDTEPGAGVFVLSGDRLYVGTRTALFVYRIDDLRTLGGKAPRRELYDDLDGRPEVYDGRYLGLLEGKGGPVTRTALFDTKTGREFWSDASGAWRPERGTFEAPRVVELYFVTAGAGRSALVRLRDGRVLHIGAGCSLQASNERYAAALCGAPARLNELTLFDLNAGKPEASKARSEQPVSSAKATRKAPSPVPVPVLARWTGHRWILVGSTRRKYFFGRNPDGLVAVDRNSGAVVWRNRAVCVDVSAVALVRETLYAGCPGAVAILNRTDGRALRKQSVGMEGIGKIVAAGERAIAVEGWTDGAALRNELAILDRHTLEPITGQMTDSTFLGVIRDRAYIDDWCCLGRDNEYRPATIYSISLKNGAATRPVDLYPQPKLHPARMQPLGQGEKNYLRGDYFYVVTPNYTYRYDIRNLRAPPRRTITPGGSLHDERLRPQAVGKPGARPRREAGPS